MAIILIPKLTGKYLKIFPKIEKIIFLLHTLLLVGRLDLANIMFTFAEFISFLILWLKNDPSL